MIIFYTLFLFKLYQILKVIYGAIDVKSTDLPWLKSENNTIDDDYRIAYLTEHIKAIEAALSDGLDLFEYTMRGCIDLVSDTIGQFVKRYGFVYVDLHDDGSGDFACYPKKSFYWYKDLIENSYFFKYFYKIELITNNIY